MLGQLVFGSLVKAVGRTIELRLKENHSQETVISCESRPRKVSKNSMLKLLTDVMLLLSAMDTAMALPPSGPRLLLETLSYVHGGNEE